MKSQKKRPECNNVTDVVLANVNMTEEEFLNPSKKFSVDNLDKASALIVDEIKKGSQIYVVGDYDADGICASSIMKLALTALGSNPIIRLPRRFSEGYGLSEKIVDEIPSKSLLITVDNGIAAAAAIKKAKDKGITVIVTDHHLGPEDGILPDADVVIDPNAIENSAEFNGYCGAGLAYKLSLELLGEDHQIIPKLRSFAAIATIADVMNLVEENRLIVKQGLADMITYKGRTTGLGALLETCSMDNYISAKNVAFKIGPIINAAGRMADDGAMTSFETVSFNSRVSDAKEKAAHLNDINEMRKAAKEEGLAKVRQNVVDNCLFCDKPLIIYEPSLMEGLVGIFAGKMAEEFKTPCFVLTDSDEEGIIKGSARTYGPVNIKEMLDKCSSFLYKYGGHAEAAGLSLYKKDLDDFRMAMADAMPDVPDEDDCVYYDLEINANQIPEVLEQLGKYEPFGNGNPEIIFRIKDFMLSPGMGGYYRTMGTDGNIIKLLGMNADAIGFGMTDKYIEMGEPKTLDLIGTLSKNYYMGKFTTQVEIIDFIDSGKAIAKSPMAAKLAEMAKDRYKS